MAATVRIPIEQYLENIDQKPSPEYVEGELVQRASPSYRHGKAAASFAAVFQIAGRRHPLFACTETHMRISSARVRIPDVAVFFGSEPATPIPTEPPGLIVEVLSPDDAWSSVMSRLRDFHDWGVGHVWLADPERRELYVYTGRDVKAARTLELREFGISVGPDDVF